MSDIQGDAQLARVILAPFETVWECVHDPMMITKWAPNVVTCCLVENGLHSDVTGCIRRQVLKRFDDEPEMVIRDELVSRGVTKNRAFMTHRILHSGPRDTPSPFTMEWRDLAITMLLTPVDSFTQRKRCNSYVEFYATFACDATDDAKAMQKYLEEKWFYPLLEALNDHVLNREYPVQSGFEVRFRDEMQQYEGAVVRMAADPAVAPETTAECEAMLNSWVSLTHSVGRLEDKLAATEAELASARHIASASAARIVELETKLRNRKIFFSCAEAQTDPLPEPQPVEQPPPPPPPRRELSPEKSNTASRSAVTTLANGAPVIAEFVETPNMKFAKAKAAFARAVSLGLWLPADEVRTMFTGLDIQCDGDLTVHFLRELWESAEIGDAISSLAGSGTLSPKLHKSWFDHWVQRHALSKPGYVTFDEFALLMIQIANR